jgi:dTDP-4-dehydrorhamnose 3,5-epimerase
MRFTETSIPGVHEIDLEPFADDRGLFARTFCAREFSEHGLRSKLVQTNLSVNRRRGTLRGFHYQLPPATEAKLIRCIRGSLFDVVIDLRADSPTYLRHHALVLSAENRRAIYVPDGCANAFLTLEEDTEAIYQVSEFYTPGAERGVRWDDPALAISWPIPVEVISDKDASWPLLGPGGSADAREPEVAR